ncbi:titin homolog isoform X5 [Manduca sexta]|uniref:titin homolog isoform X5 n=1 Tax=Manduca sexta TaxID=7130 RepID=UPI00188E7889|nr:titin homolog isoform X5 [Manduca sexta]
MEPPSFPAGGPQTVRAAPGSDAHLVVPAPSGTAPFHFQWSRAGAALEGRFASSEEPGAVRLTVSAARTDDTGLYTLQASNAAGSDTARVRLEVSADEAPTGEDPPTFLRRLQDLTVKVGTRTRFLVEILSNTECKVTWYRNERRLLEAERVSLARDGNFWCADVAAVSVDDAGRWTCTAENAGGRASCSAHLNVLVPKAYKRPEFVEELRALLTELGTVSLECKVVGVPTPVLRWFKDSREIKAGDVFALTANADDPTSLGTYTCEAVNCMGRAYSSSKVHVVGRASREGSTRPAASGITGEPPPIFTRELEDQFARICEPLTLSCQVVVPPWPRSVVWYNKEGKVEPSERYHVLEDGVGGYMLEIPSAEWADEGEWKCVATSSGGRVGISTCIVSMDVPKNYRKPRFMENLQAVLTEEGLVSFECKVVGFPTPVLSWFKDGQELKPGDVYQLTGTNSLGSYCCIARNCMGQASSSAELTVEDIQNQLNEEEKLQLFSKNQAPKFVQGLKSVESKIDEPFRFTIKVAIPPEPSVLWYRDDQPVDESARCHLGKEERGVFFLDIENLEFLDQAEWKCVAMNDFGHSVTSCFLKLIIPRHYKKPRFLENLQAILSDEGAVNLECKVIGVPQPVLKWYKDGEELKPGDIHRIISGQDGTCCLGTYTCEASNCMGVAASSASLLGFEDSMKAKEKKKAEEQALQRNLSLSTIHEERTSQMYDTPVGDITLDDKGEISFSFDGKEVSVSLYETPDLTEEEALQIVEMYADQLSENVTEHNVVELPPLRFVKETSTSGNLLMEAIIIDVSPEYFTSPEEDLRTEADVEDISIADENGPPQLSLDQDIDIAGEDYLEKTMALLSEEKADLPLKLIRKKSDSQRSAEDFFSLSREQSLSEEKRDDDTQALSESELHSFASAHSSSKPKSKSSKPSVEDGQESSEPTKTILFKDELRKSVEVEVEPATVKPKRERRTSRGSRRSSSGSEKSISRSKEEPVKVKSEVKTETEAPKKPSMTGEEFRTKMSNVSASLTQVINDVQLIERDIILKSELMSSAATASRSLELISSLITPLSEIHSIADAAKETATESKEVSSTLFNRLPQSLKSLHQSLTIIEKCIDVESDNRTLVKKTCVSFIENCGAEIQKLSSEIKSVTSTDYLTTDDKVLSEIDSLTKEMSTVIKFSADTIKAKNLLSEASEIKVEEPSLQTRHLRDTQKAVFELRTPLNSLLRIVESADSGKIVEISKIKSSDVILNDMSASIQDLQTSLEQIESLSVKESTSPALQKYNTEIIETVVDSILKLRNSFEKLSTDTKVDDKIALKETIKSIKENLNEISTQIGTIERNVGTFDVLQSDNKLDVLQKMAQILITLENNLPRLETMPEVKTHMESFHKNLTKVLENVIESNEAKKYFTLMEICDAVNRINSSIKDIDTENVLPLASLSNTLTIIKDNFVNNVFESELNCSVLTNITDVLVGIQEAINKAEEVSFQVESEHIQDLSPQVFDAMRANMVVEHIDQTIAAINTVRSIETTTEAKSSFAPVLETICPVLEDLRKYIASVGTLGTEHDEHISDISEASFAETIATPLCELNQNLIVLNQSIVENIVSLKESNVIISAVAEPLYELQKTLEIIQQEVISQYGEDLTPYEISVNMASAVQNLQSCILMIQEEAGVEGLDEMSTLEDISGIKTTADTIPSDRLVVPTAEETTTEQNLETFSEEVPKSATAKALHTLNEHIAILQNPEILDALDTLSEVSDYSSLKSVALGLGELHSGIQEILHPIIMEGSSDISNLVNISKLATIAQPLHELQQSLSVLEMNNIPIYENILELPAEKLHSVIEKITDFKEHLDKCAQAIFPAIELADQSIEISNKIGTLRELCEHLKDIIVVTKDGSSDVPASKEVEALEVVVDTLIEATDPMTGITIEKVKSITQELFKKVLEVQEELIQFIPQSPEKLAREAKLIDGMDEVEKSIAVLQEYDFVDLSRVSDITSCTSPQLAMEIDSDSLMQVDDLAANAVNVVQDSNQDMPLADLMIVEDFFKTCKNEFTVLRCLISKASSHKKIVRLLQEFNTLQTTVEEFKTKRFQLSLSDDVNGCLTSFLIQAEECLKNVRNSLVEIVNSQSELLFKEPTAQLNKSVEMLSKLVVEQKDKQLVEVVTKLCNVVLVTKPSMENIQVGVIQELQQPLAIKTREDNQLVKAMEQFMEYIEEQTKISSSIITSNTLKEVLKCIQKYQDFRDATPTGKVLIILKCLSSCADVLRERLLGYKQVEVTEHTAPEGKLRKVLTEMLEPLQVLHSQLVDIQHQVLSGVQEDLISIDIDSTESLVKTMTEKHQDIIQTLESEVTLVANEELSLIMEVDKEIHSIQNAIKSVEDVQATQSMVEIAKPIEIIEKSLQDIISSDKLALESNEKLPKDINSNIDSLECALERFINIEIDLMVASMLLVDIDVNESMQLAVELKSLLTLSPKELASPKVVEMKNETIASLKANLSKFDWLNTDECLKGKPLLQVEKLKRVFLTTYQLLTELNNVNQPAKTKFNEIKQEEKAAELIQHIDQYIELIEIVEEISAIIKIEDLKEAVDIAKELRESISTSEAMKEEETGEITHEISTEQARLALKLQRALMALHVQVLDSAQELAPELSTEVLQRIAKVTAQLQADLVAVTGVHVAVQAPSELIETVKCVQSVEKETLTVQTVPTEAAIEETVATVLEQVEEVKAPEDDKNEAFVSIMEKESVQLQEIVAAEEEQPLVEKIKPESRIMPTAEEAESLASTTTEIVDQTLDRITEISPAEQASIKVIEETAVQYREKILLEDITAIAMETGEEVADVITQEQPAAVDVTERAVVEQIEELKLIDNVEQVTAKEIKEDSTQYQTEQDMKEVVAETITAESSVTAEAAIFAIDEKADELNVGTISTEDVVIAEIVKLVDEQVTASEPKTLDSEEKVDIKSAEEILSVEITESAAIEKAEYIKVEELIMDNQLAKATEQTTSDDQEPITSHDMAIVTSKEVVEQTTTQAEDTEELSFGKATSIAEKVTEISKQIADEQEPEKEAVVVQETLLVEEAKPVSEVLPDSAELKTVEQPAVEIIESLLLEAVSQTEVQEIKIQDVAVRLSEEAIQEIQEIVAVEDITLPEETKPENTDVMPTEQAAAETNVEVVVEDISISKTEDIAKEHAIPRVAEVLSVAVASEAASVLEDITSQAEKAVDEIQESTTMEVADEKVEALVAQHPVPVTEDMKSPIDKLKQHIDEFVCENLVEEIQQLSNTPVIEGLKTTIAAAKELKESIETLQPDVKEVTGEVKEISEAQTKLAQQLQTALSVIYQQALETLKESDDVNRNTYEKIVEVSENLMADLIAVVNIAEVLESVQEKDEVVAIESQVDVFEQQVIEAASMITTQTGTVGDTEAIKEKAIQTAEAKEEIEVKAGENAEALEKHVAVIEESIVVESIDHRIMKSEDEKIDVDNARVIESAVSIESKALESEDLLPEEKGESLQSIAVSEETELVEFKEVSTDKPKSIIQEQAKESSEDALARACVETLIQHMNQFISEDTTQILDKISSALQLDESVNVAKELLECLAASETTATDSVDAIKNEKTFEEKAKLAQELQNALTTIQMNVIDKTEELAPVVGNKGLESVTDIVVNLAVDLSALIGQVVVQMSASSENNQARKIEITVPEEKKYIEVQSALETAEIVEDIKPTITEEVIPLLIPVDSVVNVPSEETISQSSEAVVIQAAIEPIDPHAVLVMQSIPIENTEALSKQDTVEQRTVTEVIKTQLKTADSESIEITESKSEVKYESVDIKSAEEIEQQIVPQDVAEQIVLPDEIKKLQEENILHVTNTASHLAEKKEIILDERVGSISEQQQNVADIVADSATAIYNTQLTGTEQVELLKVDNLLPQKTSGTDDTANEVVTREEAPIILEQTTVIKDVQLESDEANLIQEVNLASVQISTPEQLVIAASLQDLHTEETKNLNGKKTEVEIQKQAKSKEMESLPLQDVGINEEVVQSTRAPESIAIEKTSAAEHSLIEHINELASDEVSEAIENISAVTNKEELKESVVAAKELRECVAGLCANIEEEAGIMPASSKEKAQLAQKLLDSLIVLNTQILDNAQDLTPVIETSTLEKVASIITHLKEDLQTVVVIYEPGVFTADIQKICDIPEENSLKRLELLLQEVNAKINLASPDRNAEDSEVLRDTLDEVQTVIIKLKRDYDEAVNDALNETLEDLECSVRSVQLQINEDSPPELLKEACATLQLLLNNMSETQNMEISETVIKDKKSQTLLEKCSEETQETVKLLDDACKIEAVTHTNLANIVSDLNKLKETIKALRLNFLSDAQTIIDRGIDVTQSLDQVEDRVYSLEKDIDNERQMPSEVRDCIITAIHSVFGSISNMRSTISSIQKRYMFENYGKPSETLLRTIKNVSDIAKLDEEEKIPDWKKFSKSLRKVLNHFEDIKFYINLDKTARLPSDAAFTKIILEDLKLCINEVIITHEIMTKAEESKKVKDTLKCVDKYLGTIESKSALDVKEKIPIFKDIASRIYDVSDAIKKALKIFKVTEIEVELDEMTEPDAKINAAVSEEIKGEESATKVEIDQEKLDLQQAEMLDVEASESSLRHTEDVLVKDAIILIAAEIQNKTEESSDEISKLIATEMSTDTKQTEETVLIPEEDIKSEVVLQTIETVVLHKAEVAQAIADVQISPDIQKDEFVVVYDNEEKLEVMTISSQKEESSDQALQSIVEQKADAQTAKREKIEFKAAKEVEETQERIEVEVVGDSQVQEQVVLDTERSRTQLEGSIDKNRENISQQDKYDTFETETNIVQEKHDDSLLVEEESKQSLVSTEEKKNVTELLRENNVSQKEVAQETAVPADNSIKKKLKIDANLEDISVQQECNTTDDKSDETKIKKKKSPKKKAKSAKTSPGEEETKIEQIESEIVDTGRRSIKERKISDVEEKKEEEQTPTEEKAITVIEEVESPAVQEEKATASLHAGDVDKDDQSYKKEFERLDDEMKVNANKPEKLGQEKVIEQDKSKTETIGKENIVQEEPEKHRLQKEEQNKVTVKSEIKEENLDNEKKEKVSLDKKEPEKESEGTEKLEKERMEREQLETKRLEKEQMETEILEKELLEKEHLDRAEVKKQQIEQERLEKEEQEKLVNEKEEKEKFRQDKKEKIKEEKQEERLEKELTEKEKIEKEQLEKERLEKEQLDKERLEKEQFEKEKIEKDKLEKDRLEKEKIEKEQLEKERLEKEQLANERLEKEKLEKEHLDKERLEKEQLEKEKVQREQLEKDRLEKEKLEKEQLEKKRLEKEHLDKERLEKEQLEKEKVEREQLEKDRLEKEKLEKEQLEKEKLEKEYLDKERLEKEQLEKEKVEREQLEKDRIEKEKLEEEQLEKERLEKEHIDKERLEKEHLDKEILEKEQFEKERLEKEQLENEKLEKEKLDKEQIEKERLEKEHLNKERLEKEKLEKELLEKERLEKEQLDKERLEKEKQEKDQLGKESVEKELIEKERLKKEELDREKIEKEQTEKIRLEKEEQEKLENEKQEKKKLRKEKKENQAKEKLEKEKREKEEEQLEKERLEKEQLEKEVIETEKLGKSQVEKERVEKELLEKEKLQKEQQEKLERERLEKEKLEKEKEKIDRLDKESIKEEQLVKERLEKELLEKEMLEKEEHEKFECEKKENERLRKEKEEKTKREKEEKGRLEQENLVKEKEEKERLEKERSEKEQIDKERLEKEKLEKEKVEKEEREKLESEKKEKEKLRKEKREKIKREREENERLEQEKLDKEKDRLEKERLEKEQLDNERLEKERLEREKLEKEEHEKLESEKKEKEKLRKEKKEKIKREREENERLEQEKLDKEKEEKDRLEKERLEKEQLDNERLEKERLQREKFEKEEHEKLESEKKEKERLRKEKKEKIKREREEKERLEQEKLDKEKEEKDRFEKERLEKEQLDNERLEKEKIEREKLEKEDYEKLENEKKEKEKLRKEKKEKIKREKEEKERLEQENLDKEKGRLEKERLEKEQLDKLRLEKGQIEKEKLEKEEKEKLESEKEEERLKREKDEKIKREKEENERFEKEYLESEKEKLEMEKLEKEQLLKEKTEKERLEKELIKDKLETEEQDKLESEKKEKERLRKEKREKVKREKQEKEKNEIESLEKEHQEKDKFEKEKLEKEKLETEKKEKEGLRKDKIDFIVAEENKTPEKKKIIKKKSRDSDESKTIKTTAQRDIILSEDDTAKEDKQLKIQHEVEEKAQTSKSKEFQTSSEEIVQKGTRKFDELQSSIRTAENGHISIDRRERQEDVFTGESSRRHDAREIPKFVDHNHRNYTMEFARPSGYRERTCDDRPESSEYLSTTKNATIYKAETIYLESQLRAPAPQYSDLRSSEPSERREQRQRSKALSEARSVVSDRRAGSRDLKRKPVFSTYLTDRTAVEGSRVKLTCSALSSTELTITWYKNGVLLDNKLKYRTKFVDGLITLEVLNAVPSDSAEYSCTVENENGSISTSAILKVYPSFEASPIPPTFTRSIRDTYHLAEDELVLECRIRGQPLPTITWLKDERPVSSERHQAYYLADGVCRLAISHPTPEDSGKYTCKAENSMWSDQITHVVSYTGRESRLSPNLATVERSRFNRHALETRRPHFGNVLTDYQVVKGGTIGLQVEIRGCPTRVEWLREGRSVTEIYRNARTFVEHGLYTLALSDVTEKESGLYTCRAWSTHGNVDMNAAITVVQPNELDGKPAIIVGRPEKDILISVGEDINISFRVQGEPKPKVIFMKGIRDITTSQRVCKMTSDDYVKFTVKRSVVSDAGTYCILARNAYGCDRAFVTVVVRQRASSENLISDWTYPLDDTALSISERKYKSVPDRVPGEPSVVDGGNNWLSLAWPKPDPGAVAPVLAYKVESWLIGKEGGARWVELGITPLNSFDAFNLKQGEEYHFRVTPRNRYGWGEPTQTSTPIGVGLAGARPEFVDILPGQLKVLAGETANLSCSVKGKPTPEVIWMKNGHEIEEEGRMATSFNGYDCCLTIKDINNEDDGRYSCEASNLHGRASTYARLAVVTDRLIWEADAKLKRERSQGVEGEYPPQFTMRLRDRRVQATYPVRLTCQVVGNPPPTVTWYKDGEEVATDNRHNKYQDEHFHTLEIAPTNLEDGGMYEALARNPFGAVSCRCGLVVDKGIRAYVAPEFCCGLDPLYRLNEGEELRISAVVEAYPSVGVTWYRDGVRLRPSRRAIMTLDRDGQIELALAAVSPRDGGVYTCTASNEVGRASTSGKVEVVAGEASCETKPPAVVISPDVPYSKEPMFIRKPRSSEAYEGDTVIIQCEVVGDPKPDVYWLRDFLKPDYYRDASHFKRVGEGPEYRFEIPHAKLDYTGAYSVVARNVHGEAKAVISLQIKVKDPCAAEDAHNVRYGRVEVLPRFERNLTDLLSYDGDAVEFECRVSGNPEPYVRWFHYNELIRDCPDFEALYEEGAARLKIKQVTAEDEGTYTCEAANCLGKARSSACLVVYPPGEPNMLSQRLRRPPALLSATSTPRSTPRSTPARSVSRTPGPEPRRLCSPARQMAPAFYTYPFNKVVEEGDSVVFQCAVKGLPAPWATWDKDGIILTPTARITVKEKDEILRILEIDEVTIEDVGIYRITVENEFGRAEASARLEVITRKGKFYGGLRAYSVSPRRSLGYRRRPSTPRQD